MNKTNIRKIIALLLITTIIALLFPQPSRAILGLLLVLFIPGYISTYAFFKKDEIDTIERLAFSTGLSISFVVLTVMFSNLYLKIPITKTTILIEIAGICLIFTSIIIAKRSPEARKRYRKSINILTLNTKDPKKTLRQLAITTLALLLLINFTYTLIINSTGSPTRNSNQEYTIYDMSEMSKDTAKGIQISHPEIIDYENNIVFLGYDLSPALKRGEKASLTYYFTSKKDTDVGKLTIVTEFRKESSIFENHLRFPNIVLKKDEIVSISNKITIPKDIKATIYTIHLSIIKGDIPKISKISHDIGKINIPYYFNELYQPSMKIQSYYNKINTTKTGIIIGYPIVYNFDNQIAFLGYDLDTKVTAPGSRFKITYYWKPLDHIDKDYTVFVHIVDMTGKIIFQQDHTPPIPTSQWLSANIISETYDVLVPSHINDSTYRIRLGLYDPLTGKRLQLSGKNRGNNAPYLGDITIRKKTVEDYHDKPGPIRIIDTIAGTKTYTDNVLIQKEAIVDYGSLLILGYDLTELHKGRSANLTYYIKAEDQPSDLSIHTLLTETTGPGIITLDTDVPLMQKGDIIALKISLDIPHSYNTGESIFTFTVKDKKTGKYLKSPSSVIERITIH